MAANVRRLWAGGDKSSFRPERQTIKQIKSTNYESKEH
jgi:hypothetical protein